MSAREALIRLKTLVKAALVLLKTEAKEGLGGTRTMTAREAHVRAKADVRSKGPTREAPARTKKSIDPVRMAKAVSKILVRTKTAVVNASKREDSEVRSEEEIATIRSSVRATWTW
jgi:hypothetical protein